MSEDKRKLCIWVPAELYSNIVNAGYTSPTTAVIKGLEKLLEDTECQQETSNIMANYTNLLAENTKFKNEIERLTTALQDAPDSNELTKSRVKSEELEKHTETLKKELEDIKSMHNNYMMQMQTLINQKAIEAPGAKKLWWRFW